MKMLLTTEICLMLGLTFDLGLAGCGGSGAAIPNKPILSSPTPPSRITEYLIPTPASRPSGIKAGPDGNVWFAEEICTIACGNQPWGKIGRITPSGSIAEFPLSLAPYLIATGADGNLWFTTLLWGCGGRGPQCHSFESIGSIAIRGTVGQQFPVRRDTGIGGFAAGPDGNLWFTESNTNNVSKITKSGTITEFPTPSAASRPRGITVGPDGNLWFTESDANNVGRITISGTITEYPIPTAASGAAGITKGPDGNLWFTEDNANNIGRITISGTVTEFRIPTAVSNPCGIVGGSDGNVWFSETSINANKVSKITTSGTITEYPIPTANSGACDIAAGPDGNVWFTEPAANRIGKLTLNP
jgi:streptogramin lyase